MVQEGNPSKRNHQIYENVNISSFFPSDNQTKTSRKVRERNADLREQVMGRVGGLGVEIDSMEWK